METIRVSQNNIKVSCPICKIKEDVVELVILCGKSKKKVKVEYHQMADVEKRFFLTSLIFIPLLQKFNNENEIILSSNYAHYEKAMDIAKMISFPFGLIIEELQEKKIKHKNNEILLKFIKIKKPDWMVYHLKR